MKFQKIKLFLSAALFLGAALFTSALLEHSTPVVQAKSVAMVAVAPLPSPDIANIPTAFSYQGTLRLADGSLATGNFTITIKIYNSVTGGNALHSESFANTVARNGSFSVIVGDTTPINPAVFDNAHLYLGITVAPDPEMLPRQRLLPVPWAMQASSAQSAVNAQTANTLIANATIPGQLIIDRGDASVGNGKWPALQLKSNGDGYGSAIVFHNTNGNQNWSIHPAPSGELRIEDRNNGQVHVYINQNGTTTVNHLGVIGHVNVIGKVYARQGFNGACGFVAGTAVNCNMDVAETFATEQRTEPGDLVVFIPEDRTRSAVRLTSEPYAGMIVGVVSTNPGLVFDEGKTYLAGDNVNLITDTKTVVAMIGRVPTKFSLENGPIAVGDPLTSSSSPGVAMKATGAGSIIGYAMQSSAAAEDGKILVWLQIGTYIPPATLAVLNDLTAAQLPVAATTAAADDQTIAELQAQIATLAAQVDQLSAQLSAQLPARQAVNR